MIVSSHCGTTRRIPQLRQRWRVALILNVVGPVLSRALGYMPGERLRLGLDLPAAAMIEWGKWARLENYFFDDPSMSADARAHALTTPLLAVGASDDLWATPQQMDALVSHTTHASVTRETLTPADLGVGKIGHHGLLRRGVGEPLWPRLAEWFEQEIPQP